MTATRTEQGSTASACPFRRRTSVVWLGLLAMAVAWSPAAGQPVTPDPAAKPDTGTGTDPEPDDEASFARIAPLHWETQIDISGPDDVDWLRFIVPVNGIVTLRRIGGGQASQALRLEMWDGDAANAIELPAFVRETDDLWTGMRLAAGEYLLKATGGPDPASHRLLIDFELDTDEAEPNDTAETANRALGRYAIRTWPQTDQDWFVVPAAAPSVLEILIDPGADRPHAGYAGYLTLDGDDQKRPVPFRNLDGNRQRLLMNVRPGKHLVQLWKGQPDPALTDVEFGLTLQDDPFEPNDTSETPAPLPWDRAVDVRLFPGDEDWFYVDTPAAGLLTVRTFGADDARPGLGVQTVEAQPVNAMPGSTRDVLVYRVTPGRQLLRLTPAGDTDRRFTLRAGFAPTVKEAGASFYVMGLEVDRNVRDHLRQIADLGGGEVVNAPADEGELALALAGVVRKAQGRSFGVSDFLRVTLPMIFAKAVDPKRPPFEADRFSITLHDAARAMIHVDPPVSRTPLGGLYLAAALAKAAEQMSAQNKPPADGKAIMGRFKEALTQRFSQH